MPTIAAERPRRERPPDRIVSWVQRRRRERVWSLENNFRLRLGPLSYEQFCRYLPGRDGLRPLCQLVRAYVGSEFDFTVQPVLRAAEVPPCRAGGQGPVRSQLGWNTWAPQPTSCVVMQPTRSSRTKEIRPPRLRSNVDRNNLPVFSRVAVWHCLVLPAVLGPALKPSHWLGVPKQCHARGLRPPLASGSCAAGRT